MGAGHSHGPSVSAGAQHRGRLGIALAIAVLALVLQAVGGIVTGSLALLADAGHILTDVAGIGLALLAIWFAAQPPSPRRTYGYYRVEIFSAVLNAVVLAVVAILLLAETARRLTDPPAVQSGPMLVIAVIGLFANLASLLVLRGGQKESLAVRGAYLEVLGDLLGSAAVIVAAIVIGLTGWRLADPLASGLIGLMILPRTWSLLRDAVDVLLEASPRGIDLDRIRDHIRGVPGVIDVHDLHVWTITSGMPVMSAHVVVADDALGNGCGGGVLDAVTRCLADHFDVRHCTFQLEPATHADHEHPLHA